VVIECKRPDIKESIHEAISQNIRNQKVEEIAKLFVYSQIIMALIRMKANTPLQEHLPISGPYGGKII